MIIILIIEIVFKVWVCKVNIENYYFMLCLGFVSYLIVNFKLLKVR